ncbi:MAG TPA: hypothetical protein VK181_02370 [Rhizobium sp.]|nr:hypothetical protein [Rhizobium sp.]
MRGMLRTERHSGPDAGFALVGVLLFSLLAAAILTPLVIHSIEYRRTAVIRQSATSDRLLAGGLATLVSSLAREQQLPLGEASTWWECAVGGKRVLIHLQDTAGLVDLNSAEDPLLVAGFLALGHARETSDGEMTKVVTRRGAIGIAPEPTRGETAGEAGSGQFVSVAELQELLGLSSSEQRLAEDIFTVRNKTGAVSKRALPPALATSIPSVAGASDFVGEDATAGPFRTVRIAVLAEEPAPASLVSVTYRLSDENSVVPVPLERSERTLDLVGLATVAAPVKDCPATLKELLDE